MRRYILQNTQKLYMSLSFAALKKPVWLKKCSWRMRL